MPECHSLLLQQNSYPVTLLYMPIGWITEAMSYAHMHFGKPQLANAPFSCLFSTQDAAIRSHVLLELKRENPSLRLLFCTACVGMGFDSPSISRVVHGTPPRSIVDYIQQIGRAGRVNQKSEAILYFNKSDIASNRLGITPAIIDLCTTDECLRLTMLKYFGFDKKVNNEMPLCECCSNCESKCSCERLESLSMRDT
jgi:superfamily II DNA helicase RecQ